MRIIKCLFAVLVAATFTFTANGQTVVRSLDSTNPNSPKQENQTSEQNPNQAPAQSTAKKDYSEFSFWGFGFGYAYEFPTYKGKASDGMHGFRVPLHFNHVFRNSCVGIYGMAGYEFNKSKNLTVHRVPIMAHATLNLGDPHGIGFFMDGGPGLNIMAGGKYEYYDSSKKKTVKQSLKARCDVTMGVGVGLVIKSSIIIHVGFNGALTDNSGAHQCDLDASVWFTF